MSYRDNEYGYLADKRALEALIAGRWYIVIPNEKDKFSSNEHASEVFQNHIKSIVAEDLKRTGEDILNSVEVSALARLVERSRKHLADLEADLEQAKADALSRIKL